MRKCSNCNKLCPDTEKFCQTCGLPTTAVEETVTAELAPVKKKKTGLILGIIGAIAALAAVAAILLIPKKAKGDPMHRFFDAQEHFIENEHLVKKGLTIESLMCGEFKPTFTNISTDAELSFELDGIDLGSIGLDVGLGDIDISDKLSKLSLFFQIDNKTNDALTGVQLRYNGSAIISATIETTDKGLSVYIPELSDKCYELSSEFFTKLMSGSADLGDGEMPAQVEVKFDRVEDLKKSYEALKKDYDEIFYKGFAVEDFVQKDGAFKLENLGVDAGDCREITYTPNAERLTSMIYEMAERIKTDKALSDHILTLMENYLGEKGMKFVFSALCSNGDIELGDNGLLPVFEKLANSLNDNREEVVKAIDDAKLTWCVVSKGDEVLAQYAAWDKGNLNFEKYEENFYLDAKDNGKSLIKLTTDLKKDGDIVSGRITLLENDNMVRSEITVEGCNSAVKSALGIPYGKYTVDLSAVTDFAEATKLGLVIEVAKGENGGTDHSITVTGLDALGENVPDRLAFKLHTTDTDSTASRPTAEVVRIESEEQLNGVVEEMNENLSGVLMKLMLMLMF